MPYVVTFSLQTLLSNLLSDNRKSHSSKQKDLEVIYIKPIRPLRLKSLGPCCQFALGFLPVQKNVFCSTLAVGAVALYLILLLRNFIIQFLGLTYWVGYNTHRSLDNIVNRAFTITPGQFLVTQTSTKKVIVQLNFFPSRKY